LVIAAVEGDLESSQLSLEVCNALAVEIGRSGTCNGTSREVRRFA
jgi:hypothetical protein